MHEQPDPPPRVLDFDLYCMRCGYNLRGLSGDPIRCPECSKANEIETVKMTAPLVSGHIARVESAMLSMVLAVLIVVPLVLLATQTGRGGQGPWWMIFGVLIAPVHWYRSARQYASLTRGVSSALSGAVAYQAGAILWCLFVGTGLLWPLTVYRDSYLDAPRIRVAMMFSAVVIGVCALVGVPRYCLWIRTKLDPLKREVAVKVVEAFLRSRDREQYLKETKQFANAVDDDAAAS